MITLFRANEIQSLEQAKDFLRKQLLQLPRKISPIGTPKKVIRFEVECHKVNLLGWLHNQKHGERIYWSCRDRSFEVAGLGVSESIHYSQPVSCEKLVEEMTSCLTPENPNLRFYGGMAFDPRSLSEPWGSFGAARFIIPMFELFRYGDKTILAFNIAPRNIVPEKIDGMLKLLDEIDCDSQTTYRDVPEITERSDFPSLAAWKENFQKLTDENGNFLLEKVVLARLSKFKFNVKLRPSALIKHLKDQTPNCFHFCFQTDEHHAFLGASPERLFLLEGRQLESEAVAGTTSKGRTAFENKKQEEALLSSAKFRQEHRFVVEAIENAFKELCLEYHADAAPGLLRFPSGQHLVTRFNGKVNERVSAASVLKQMHPTPAVAGTNTQDAVRMIRDVEPFSRGWYAGPVGYVGPGTTEFAVAIRSGLIRDNTLSLYAGAGIVHGSDPEEEWAEIENKISQFMEVFRK